MDIEDHSSLKRLLSKPDFNQEKFVQNVSKNESPEDIKNKLQKLNNLAIESGTRMKRSIYENYLTYIHSGKAVNSLEVIMHQINNQINELQRIINLIDDTQLIRASQLEESSQGGISIAKILEEVHGVTSSDFSQKTSVNCICDIVEIEEKKLTTIDRFRVYLCEDCILLASVVLREERHVYTKSLLVDLDKVSVFDANINDQNNAHYPPFTIGLLVNMQARYFKFFSAPKKINFIQYYETAHRKLLRLKEETTPLSLPFEAAGKLMSNQTEFFIPEDITSATISALKFHLHGIGDLIEYRPVAISPYMTLKPTAPLGDETFTYAKAKAGTASDGFMSDSSGLFEIPEDLDVALAERDFEKATSLVENTRRQLTLLLSQSSKELKEARQLTDHQTGVMERVINTERKLNLLAQRVDEKASALVNVLQQGIVYSSDRQGSSRIVRRYVQYLTRLDRSNLAAQLFLIYRGRVMHHALGKGLRLEGNQLLHINRLSMAFARNLIMSVVEFNLVIGNISEENPQKCLVPALDCKIQVSKLSSWVLDQLELFVDQIKALLIDNKSISFNIMCRAVERVQAHLKKVESLIGMAVMPVLEQGLFSLWTQSIQDQAKIIRESSTHRVLAEKWEPMVFTSQVLLEKWCQDLINFGIADIDRYVPKPGLASSVGQLARSLCNFTSSIARIGNKQLMPVVMHELVGIIRSEIDTHRKILLSPDLLVEDEKREFILVNIGFLIRSVLPVATEPLRIRTEQYVNSVDEFSRLYKQHRIQ